MRSFTTAFVWHFDLRFWIAYLILFQFQFALNFSYKKLFPKIAPLLRDRFHCLQTLYFGGRVDMSSVPLVQEYYLFCYLILYNTQVNFCFQNSCWKYISSFWLKTQIELAKVAWFSLYVSAIFIGKGNPRVFFFFISSKLEFYLRNALVYVDID